MNYFRKHEHFYYHYILLILLSYKCVVFILKRRLLSQQKIPVISKVLVMKRDNAERSQLLCLTRRE